MMLKYRYFSLDIRYDLLWVVSEARYMAYHTSYTTVKFRHNYLYTDPNINCTHLPDNTSPTTQRLELLRTVHLYAGLGH
jgi:hypothetical protein